ncbi:cupin domain-containing protein [Clostridium beijerinckii]|uniref:cupin domain-containing protein n=1 Tax=Clostridium beijerinckii TaxID=1520 RepID=UPI000809C559|nr:cupin domain-containing protein [Clostridium beijerinckii]MDG5855104.1 cupin domain-containing protein [Clostridium beijerinckii]OCB00617.1 cupin [Clostridium beijerinckii]
MFCFNKDVEFEVLDENTKRKVLVHDEKMMAVEVHFKKATNDVETHSHVHDQLSYVLKGSFKFIVGDKSEIVREGDTIFMPSNIPHGCIVLEDNSIVYDVFTPERKDFLKNN